MGEWIPMSNWTDSYQPTFEEFTNQQWVNLTDGLKNGGFKKGEIVVLSASKNRGRSRYYETFCKEVTETAAKKEPTIDYMSITRSVCKGSPL